MGNQKLSRAYFLKNVTLALKGEFMKIRKCHRYFSTLSPAFAPQAQKKKEFILQQCRVLLFFFFLLLSRAFINVTPFFTKFVTGNFLCHGREFPIFVAGNSGRVKGIFGF